jgi:hypothetical protein
VTTIPLAQVPAATPLCRVALGRHLGDVRLPPRSAMLLRTDLPGRETADERADGGAGPAVRVALRALVGHLWIGSADAVCVQQGVGSLVGLGPGLTPTGDDVLVALVATSRRLANGGLFSAASTDRLAAAVAAIPEGRTTPVAHHLLSEATRGFFPRPLASLVGALGDPNVDSERLAGLVARLAAIGAHSGADWLAGALALANAAVAEGGAAWPSA